MSATYELWLLHHADGHPIALVDSYSALEYSKVTNGIGAFTLTLPSSFDISIIQEDTRLTVWRHPAGGTRTLDFVGFTRYIEKSVRGSGKYYVVSGPDINDLLDRRIVAYAAASAQAAKAAVAADNQIKAFVRENMGALCVVAARDLSSYGFTVQADLGLGTSIAKACAWRNLLTVIQEIAEASHSTETTAVYFGIVPLNSGWECEFRTNVPQFGNDHRFPSGTAGPVIFSLEFGNLADVTRNINYRDERTYIYAGGQGTEAARTISEAGDTARIGMSPFNRREDFYNSSNTNDATQLSSQAQAELRNRKPKTLFSAAVTPALNFIYGRDYGIGDYVTAVFDGETIDCRIEAVTVKISEGAESVNIQLKSEA